MVQLVPIPSANGDFSDLRILTGDIVHHVMRQGITSYAMLAVLVIIGLLNLMVISVIVVKLSGGVHLGAASLMSYTLGWDRYNDYTLVNGNEEENDDEEDKSRQNRGQTISNNGNKFEV